MHHILLDNLLFILNVYDFIYNSLSTKQNFVLGKKHTFLNQNQFFFIKSAYIVQPWQPFKIGEEVGK